MDDSQPALRSIYMAYCRPIMRYISFYVKSEADVQELVSDVFLVVWENRKELPAINNFNSYIYKISKYKALNWLRSQKIMNVDLENIPIEIFANTCTTPEDDLISEETVNHINNAIEALPSKCKQAFKLVREDKMKYRDAAEVLGISVKTLENHLALAVKKIRSNLK
ncbi:RNA polymerase sigma-70 factor [Proteiniphilum sp. UBA5384]|uniref:RNA polymerase sigma-70 factor n=1 Tax=Proteiniphilum sp. UBA5384 TaxID=1947279 RepID=UPI0025FCBBF1|nr:RNA polymerase sigma-70 factor [Proteiniphilum sp. UBA5384]